MEGFRRTSEDQSRSDTTPSPRKEETGGGGSSRAGWSLDRKGSKLFYSPLLTLERDDAPRRATWRPNEPRGGKIAPPRLIKTGLLGWGVRGDENGGEGGGANGESGETRNITELYMRVFNSVINSKNR